MNRSSMLGGLLLGALLTYGLSASGSLSATVGESSSKMKLAQAVTQGPENPIGQFRLGIQTQKSVQTPEPLRRSDCEINDECDDYSGLPKSHIGKTTAKNFRKPFIGLSLTAPLQ